MSFRRFTQEDAARATNSVDVSSLSNPASAPAVCPRTATTRRATRTSSSRRSSAAPRNTRTARCVAAVASHAPNYAPLKD